MIQLHSGSVMLQGGVPAPIPAAGSGRDKTMAYQILRRHHRGPWEGQLHLTFDSLISHDITYVGIIQTARASGMQAFPLPYGSSRCLTFSPTATTVSAPWAAPSTRTTTPSACLPP